LIYYPTTTPGYRSPALYLADETPIFKLFGSGFTLLNFGLSPKETNIFETSAANLGLPLDIVLIDDEHAKSIYRYNLVLIRPDQHVAWRSNQVPPNARKILKIASGH